MSLHSSDPFRPPSYSKTEILRATSGHEQNKRVTFVLSFHEFWPIDMNEYTFKPERVWICVWCAWGQMSENSSKLKKEEWNGHWLWISFPWCLTISFSLATFLCKMLLGVSRDLKERITLGPLIRWPVAFGSRTHASAHRVIFTFEVLRTVRRWKRRNPIREFEVETLHQKLADGDYLSVAVGCDATEGPNQRFDRSTLCSSPCKWHDDSQSV